MQETPENSTVLWAHEEFGSALLGDKRRHNRLLSLAQQVCDRPGGKMTKVFDKASDREAAYRFVENCNVDHHEIGTSAWRACAERSKAYPYVFVPVDGCTLTLKDKTGCKGYGPIGTRKDCARGMRTLNAIAVSPDGVPLGIAGQMFWTRSRKPQATHHTKRHFHQRETSFWLKIIQQVNQDFEACGGPLRWFQLDAEGDFRQMLRWAQETDQRVTIRAGQNRSIAEGPEQYLWETLENSEIQGGFHFSVRGSAKRKQRTAHMEVTHRQVTLQPKHLHKDARTPITLYAVLAKEIGTTPDNESPIEWLLLTNVPLNSLSDAIEVIHGYSQRWRVEEFHKAWKSVCGVEESQLERGSFVTWATILASVAIRIETIKYLARTAPTTPAIEYFSEHEITAVVLLRQPKNKDKPKVLDMGHIVRWVADLGGYTGKSSGGPPGTIVLSRGLARIEPVSKALALLEEMKKSG